MPGASITQKLSLAFGTIFVLLAGFGIFMWHSLADLRFERTNVSDWVYSYVVVVDITRNVSDTQRALTAETQAAGSAKERAWRDERRQHAEATEAAFVRYQKVIDNGDYATEAERERDQKMLDEEKILWAKYQEQIERVENLLIAGRKADAEILLTGEEDRAFRDLSQAMAADIEDCSSGLEVAAATSEAAFSSVAATIRGMCLVMAVILLAVLRIMFGLARDIRRSVAQIVAVTEKAAQGDLSQEIKIDSQDEFGKIGSQLNTVLDYTRRALDKIQTASELVADSAQNTQRNLSELSGIVQGVTDSVDKTTGHVSEQRQAMQEMENRVRQMEQSIGESAKLIRESLDGVKQSAAQATSGSDAAVATVRDMKEISASVEEAMHIVQELDKNSAEIGSIVETISGIAEQTNLLALNAAIEAARAGEQGRGFAVVAEEVRKLAASSQEAVGQIGSIIGTIRDTTQDAVQKMESGFKQMENGRSNIEANGEVFRKITVMIKSAEKNAAHAMETIQGLQEPMDDIVKRVEDATHKVQNIAEEMESVSSATGEQSANISSVVESSKSLTELSEVMKRTVKEFKL